MKKKSSNQVSTFLPTFSNSTKENHYPIFQILKRKQHLKKIASLLTTPTRYLLIINVIRVKPPITKHSCARIPR